MGSENPVSGLDPGIFGGHCNAWPGQVFGIRRCPKTRQYPEISGVWADSGFRQYISQCPPRQPRNRSSEISSRPLQPSARRLRRRAATQGQSLRGRRNAPANGAAQVRGPVPHTTQPRGPCKRRGSSPSLGSSKIGQRQRPGRHDNHFTHHRRGHDRQWKVHHRESRPRQNPRPPRTRDLHRPIVGPPQPHVRPYATV